MTNFGEMLKTLRRKNFLTQDELARELEKLGCNTTTKCAVSQYENNKRLPETKTIVIIAKFFNVSIDYMFGNERTEKNDDFLSVFHRLNDKEQAMVKAYAKALYDVSENAPGV